jgi:hypothetical protein
MITTLDILRRMAAATRSPHFGGINPDTVTLEGFALPGGGMECSANGDYITITCCSLGSVPRARVRLFLTDSGELRNCTADEGQWLTETILDLGIEAASYYYEAGRVSSHSGRVSGRPCQGISV